MRFEHPLIRRGFSFVEAVASLRTTFAGPTTAVRRGARSTFHLLQEARMRGVLQRLSDRRLAELGLRRADIPDHARWLVKGERRHP